MSREADGREGIGILCLGWDEMGRKAYVDDGFMRYL